MRYIVALESNVSGKVRCDLSARCRSRDGRVLLNENDLKKSGRPLEEAVADVKGILLTEREAFNELNKEEWL